MRGELSVGIIFLKVWSGERRVKDHPCKRLLLHVSGIGGHGVKVAVVERYALCPALVAVYQLPGTDVVCPCVEGSIGLKAFNHVLALAVGSGPKELRSLCGVLCLQVGGAGEHRLRETDGHGCRHVVGWVLVAFNQHLGCERNLFLVCRCLI